MSSSRKERNPLKGKGVTLKMEKANPKKMDLFKEGNVIPVTRLGISGGIVLTRKVIKRQLMQLWQKKIMIVLRC
ncbi:hypothetical protein ACS0TY_020571 [Phlomoides rotata]